MCTSNSMGSNRHAREKKESVDWLGVLMVNIKKYKYKLNICIPKVSKTKICEKGINSADGAKEVREFT